MFRPGYHIRNQQAMYYMTFTVVGWIDLFSRKCYRDLLIASLTYCRQHKGLRLHAYVIMTNHVHLIASVAGGYQLSGFVRDFKKFTSKQLIAEIETGGQESRRDWLLHQFKYFASRHSRNETYQIWTHENHFVELLTPAFTHQKLNYIHQNPVRAGWVYQPKDYVYSSAAAYAGIDSLVEVDVLDCGPLV